MILRKPLDNINCHEADGEVHFAIGIAQVQSRCGDQCSGPSIFFNPPPLPLKIAPDSLIDATQVGDRRKVWLDQHLWFTISCRNRFWSLTSALLGLG